MDVETPAVGLYVAALSPAAAATSMVALGLVEMLAARGLRVGVLGPVVRDELDDPLPTLLLARAGSGQLPAETGVVAEPGVDDVATVLARVADRLQALQERHDVVVCVGADAAGDAAGSRLELNTGLPAGLALPVIHVHEADGRPVSAVVAAAVQERELLVARGCRLAATFVVGVAAGDRVDVRWRIGDDQVDAPVYALVTPEALSTPTLRDALAAVDATQVGGADDALDRDVDGVVVATGSVDDALNVVRERALLVTSSARTDIALLAAAAVSARGVAAPSAIVLCGPRPATEVLRLVEPSGLPVLLVPGEPDDVARGAHRLRARIWPGGAAAIAAALAEFAAGVDRDELARRLGLPVADALAPRVFLSGLLERAHSPRRHVVLADGGDERVLRAAQEVVHGQLADVTILGAPDAVRRAAARLGLRLGDARIVDPATSGLRTRLAESYVRLRSADGVTPEAALDAVAEPTCFGALMVQQGLADGLVAGATNSAAHTSRTAIEVERVATGALTASSAYLMCLPDRPVVLADCGLVPVPTAEQMAAIALRSADTATAFGIEPRVALLSYSTGATSAGADVDRVRAAAEIVAARRPDLPLAGPIQYDVAVIASVAAARMPDDPVAGRATVLVFPDVKTASTTARAMQKATGAVAVGPVLQGLTRPVNHVPRDATVADIVMLVGLTAAQCANSVVVRTIHG